MNQLTKLNTNPPAPTAAASVEQSRAIAETQAAMVVAQSRPRDESLALDKIISSCQRLSLAESSMYSFKKGIGVIEGPNIRLAEVMARCYQNITYGLRETSRIGDTSEVEAFAWDLENNVRVSRMFTVKHQRETKSGVKKLKSERDIYEMVANQGQRRVRACLLELIPGDIVEEAVKQCKATIMKAEAGGDIADTAKEIVAAFKTFNVSQQMIESFLQHSIKAITPAQVVKLRSVYKSINDGVADVADFFDVNVEPTINPRKQAKPAPVPEPQQQPEPVYEPPEQRRAAEPTPEPVPTLEPTPEPEPEPRPEPQPQTEQQNPVRDGFIACPIPDNGNVPIDYCKTDCPEVGTCKEFNKQFAPKKGNGRKKLSINI